MPHDLRSSLRPALIFGAALIVLMLLGSAWAWLQIPADARLPVHFGFDGSVKRYGSKTEALLALPGVTLLLGLILAALPWIEPRRRHLAESLPALIWIVLATMLFLAVLHVILLANALGAQRPLGQAIGAMVSLLWIAIGSVLGKLRSNFFVGIRTPWTLSSELSWQKTHRLGGKLFVTVGLLALLAAIFSNEGTVAAVLSGGTFVIVLVALAYSWKVWRDDPKREQTGT